MEQYKTCITCMQFLAASAFYVDKAKTTGLSSDCKECKKSRAKQWRLENKERHRAYSRQWLKDNPEKAYQTSKRWRLANPEIVNKSRKKWNEANRELVRLKTLQRRARQKAVKHYKVTPKDIQRILSHPCLYCGKKATQVDHVMPLIKGGNHSIGNLAPACASCNASKSGKFLSIWRYKFA